jgi:hypothetical protein
MIFLSKLLQGISLVPVIVTGVENLFGAKGGSNKKAAALSFVQTALSASDAVAGQNIADANKFTDGLSKVIDGVVQCLNASVWAERKR